MNLAKRMERLGTETAFEVLAKARKLEQEGKHIVHLEIGEPDFETADHIKNAAIEALNGGFTHYVPSAGILEVRESISKNIDNIIVKKINNINFIYLFAENYPNKSLKNFIDEQKNKYPNKSVSFIVSKDQQKLSIVLGVSDDIIDFFDALKEIKNISNILGGKGGGGRKDLAQGGGEDVSKLDKCLEYIENKLITIS